METNIQPIDTALSTLARQRVAEDLRALIQDAEALIKATAGDMSEKARETRDQLKAAIERAKVTGARLAKKADTEIHEHPYRALGVAFGVGLLAGVLVLRK